MSRLSFVLPAALLLAACGGSGGGGDAGGGDLLYVQIFDPARRDPSESHVDLNGMADCDGCPAAVTEFGFCPAINPPRSSAINVDWSNRATGASGPASHVVIGTCSCLFSYCTVVYSHRWTASVPLAIGDNVIDVRASRPGGSGSDSVTVNRLPAAVPDLAAAGGTRQVILTWNPVTGANSYDLYFSNAGDVSPATGTRIPGVSSPFTHAGLTDDVTYYYTLTTVAGAYVSPPSTVAWATSGWRTESVGTSMPTTFDSLRDLAIAMDSTDHPHVLNSYGDIGSAGTMRSDYLTNAGGSWAARNAALPDWVSAGLALDAADTVHVSYFGVGLRHAVLTGGVWTPEVAAADGRCAADLALDAGGNAHLAYFTLTALLRYASKSSGSWVSTDVAAAGGGCSSDVLVSLAIDGAGAAHVAFSGAPPTYGLKYATNRGGAWTVTALDSGNIGSVALATDGNDKVHIAYTDAVGVLRYAQNLTGAWVMEILDDAGRANDVSLALDLAGKARVAYVDARQGGELRYLDNSGGTWKRVIVDRADYGGAATDTAIAIDSLGKAHIAYYRGTIVRYATNQ